MSEQLKIIEEHEEPQSIEKLLESASVYEAIKLSSSLAKNFTQISDMLDVHLNDVDKKPFKMDDESADEEGEGRVEEEEEENEEGEDAKEKGGDEAMNDKEIEALVINVVQAIKDKEEVTAETDSQAKTSSSSSSSAEALKIKNMNLLEALTNLKNTSIYQVR